MATTKPHDVMEYIRHFPHIRELLSVGDKMIMFLHTSGWQVDIKTQTPDKWGSMLQHYTGSKLHNIHVRTLAQKKNLSLSEYGITKNDKLSTYDTEEKFYKALGMQWIPPELREDVGEIEAALKHNLPSLLELADIKGDLHMHTNHSFPSSHDTGESSIGDLINRAMELQYSYIGLSDHNPKQSGLTAKERLAVVTKRTQWIHDEIERYFPKPPKNMPKVFIGMEVDILPSGELALEDEALETLDYAIVSIHSVLSQDSAKATQRLLKALDHPNVRFIGHPTARLIESRSGIDADWTTIFHACKEKGIALEINASPQRLDLPSDLVREAKKIGCKFIIDTDAHHVAHMDFMKYGVYAARRGWAEKQDILNTASSLPWKT